MELTKQDTQMAKGMAVLGMVMLHLFCRLDYLPYTPLIWCGEVPVIFYLVLFPGFAFSAKYPILILGLMLAVCFAVSIVIDFLYRPILVLLARK